MNRRDFLRGLGGVAGASMMPLSFSANAISVSSDYKALICVMQAGGNDAFNMIIPTADSDYNDYAAVRREIAIPKASLLEIHPLGSGVGYGLHPSMGKMRDLFNEGSLSSVVNVGALGSPITLDDYKNKTADLPRVLFSHPHQQNFWNTLDMEGRYLTGWAGRIADEINQSLDTLPVNISFSGNRAQVGSITQPYTVNNSGVRTINNVPLRPRNEAEETRTNIFLKMMDINHRNKFGRHFVEINDRSMLYADYALSGLSSLSQTSVEWPNSKIAKDLKMASELAALGAQSGQGRQIFFVVQGGYDTHDNQLVTHERLYSELSEAFYALNRSLRERGMGDSVTTFTVSDFGRTYTMNGDGTDHGWGSHHLVMGDAVSGGRFIGEWPDMEIGGSLDVGTGRILPTTSVDQYYASILRWYGCTESDIQMACPNIVNFDQKEIGLFL